MADSRYAYASGKIRVLESHLLSKTKLYRIIDAATINDSWRELNDTPYAEIGQEKPKDWNIFHQHFVSNIAFIRSLSSDNREIINLLWFENDFRNIGLALKQKLLQNISDEQKTWFYPSTIKPEAIAEVIAGKRSKAVLPESLMRSYDKVKDITTALNLSAMLDYYYYSYAKTICEKSTCSVWSQFWKVKVDLINMLSFFRIKTISPQKDFLKFFFLAGGTIEPSFYLKYIALEPQRFFYDKVFVPYRSFLYSALSSYEKTGLLNEWEKASDNFLLNFFKIYRYIPYGFELVLGYYWALFFEAKNLQMIFTMKYSRFHAQEIKNNLRDTYV